VARIDTLRNPELSALLRMANGKPLNMRGFAVAAQVSPASARRALQTLVDLGLVIEDRVRQGAAEVADIRLSPAGARVAKHVAAIDALLPPES
jgi:DNA-binding GntR family transcriptional regulator